MDAEQHSTEPLTSGAVVHRWKTNSPRGVVVLQHGFGEYAERYVSEYANLVPRLLDAGLEVRALDLWGHGRSPGRRAVTSVRLAVEDHLAVRRLAAGGGLPVILVGHSLGGLVTASSACARADELAGVVLLSPALSRPQPPRVRRALGLAASVFPGRPIPEPRRPVSELSRIPSVAERAAADPLMFPGQLPVLTAATALDMAARTWAGLSAWRVPTLAVHGTADTYTDPRGSTDLVAGITSVDKALHLIDGAFHELLNDECAHDVLELVLGWIDAHITSSWRTSAPGAQT